MNIIKKINEINVYENKDKDSLILEGFGLNPAEIIEEFKKIQHLAESHIILRKKHRNTKIKIEKNRIIKELNLIKEEQDKKYNALKDKIFSTGYFEELSELNDNDLMQRMIKYNNLNVAHNLHKTTFNKTIKLIKSNDKILNEYKRELSKVNLNFKMVLALNKSIYVEDEKLYDKVCKTIGTNFSKLDSFMCNSLKENIYSCLRGDRYIQNTHKDFDKIRVPINHPEIYLCKAILSMALNNLSNQ
ncbi:hypothetical protein [Psychromonas aquatilis]|uniref:Uncharacterized protein n=1 Tax=Psychromonas aquatilis TaxID=2005072 RepID=A0ABU9GRR2_9GAMM